MGLLGKPNVKALRLIGSHFLRSLCLRNWRCDVKRSLRCRSVFVESERARMISVLAQERLLGATLGAVSAGAFVFHQRKTIYQSISNHHDSKPSPNFEIKDAAPRGTQVRHLWNTAVDQTLGPVIAYLSSRGW